MEEIPVDAVQSEAAVTAGVEALERIHGGHLQDMSPDEQRVARQHWREQVEHVLHSVAARLAAQDAPAGGRAVLVFTDSSDESVEIGARFDPDLQDAGNGEVQGTPAQILALTALQAIDDVEDADEID
jgi:hypothetical protein